MNYCGVDICIKQQMENLENSIRCNVLCKNFMKSSSGCDGNCQYDNELFKNIQKEIAKANIGESKKCIACLAKKHKEYENSEF